jgi:hypothetical protein
MFIFFFWEQESLYDRFSALVPGWEAVGYVMRFEWHDGQKDYSVMVWSPSLQRYHLICMVLAEESDRLNYVERSDFEPYWFEPHRGREWKWISEEHRAGVMEAGEKNRGVFTSQHFFNRR